MRAAAKGSLSSLGIEGRKRAARQMLHKHHLAPPLEYWPGDGKHDSAILRAGSSSDASLTQQRSTSLLRPN
jgi:hypothetical protein